jgi:hypothetical protein
MQRRVHEANLAWALARAAEPHLDTVDHNDIFSAIGAGETFEAICRLLKFVAVKRIPVKPDLPFGCRSWLHGYVGTRTSSTFDATSRTLLLRTSSRTLTPPPEQRQGPLQVRSVPIYIGCR